MFGLDYKLLIAVVVTTIGTVIALEQARSRDPRAARLRAGVL